MDRLPKVRSRALLDACADMPCSLRISSLAGLRCAAPDTVVGCHLPGIGKGTGTKVSDLFVAAGCRQCHDLLDGRDKRGFLIADMPEFGERLLRGWQETLSRWVAAGLIVVPKGKVIQ